MNLSRKKILRIFNEAMYLAENLVESGAEAIPAPEKLFTINTLALDEGGGDCDSMLSEDFLEDQEEYVVVTSDKETEVYRLPKRTVFLFTDDECRYTKIGIQFGLQQHLVNLENICFLFFHFEGLTSSVESLSEASIKKSVHELDNVDTFSTFSSEEFRDFYKPDMSTPSRFKSSESLTEESESSESIIEIQNPTSDETVGR